MTAAVPYTPVVNSLLETDLYKFTMWQALLHRHPNAHGEYEFICRNTPAFPLAELKEEVERELDHLCSLSFADDEVAYLRGLRFIKSDFADFLTVFRFQRKFIEVGTDGPHLTVRAVGPVVHVMGFEIYVLYIVNELYFRRVDQDAAMVVARARLQEKIAHLRDFSKEPMRRSAFEFFDFGVRRRFSGAWHDEVVATFAREVPEYFKGTSNVYLAKKYKLVPIGTMAHEFFYALSNRSLTSHSQSRQDLRSTRNPPRCSRALRASSARVVVWPRGCKPAFGSSLRPSSEVFRFQ